MAIKFLKPIVIVLGLISLVTFSTHSYFVDRVSSNGNEFSAGVWATPTPSPTPFQQITICHATGSIKNPYVEITIAEQGVLNGHLPHHDDIIPAPPGGCPTSLISGASVELSPTPTPSLSPTPTPTPSESLSPTESPSPGLTE